MRNHPRGKRGLSPEEEEESAVEGEETAEVIDGSGKFGGRAVHGDAPIALEEHPVETAELLGLLCFIEPDDVKNHKMTEFLSAIIELIESEEVLSFFISLARLEKRNIFTAAKV